MNKKYIRIIFGMLILIWMIAVFCFSNQPADISTNTSGNTIKLL